MTIIGDIMYIIFSLVDLLDFLAFDLRCLILQGGVRILLILLVKALCLLFWFGCRSLCRGVLRESIGYLYVWTCNLVFSRCTINERDIMYIISPKSVIFYQSEKITFKNQSLETHQKATNVVKSTFRGFSYEHYLYVFLYRWRKR